MSHRFRRFDALTQPIFAAFNPPPSPPPNAPKSTRHTVCLTVCLEPGDTTRDQGKRLIASPARQEYPPCVGYAASASTSRALASTFLDETGTSEARRTTPCTPYVSTDVKRACYSYGPSVQMSGAAQDGLHELHGVHGGALL